MSLPRRSFLRLTGTLTLGSALTGCLAHGRLQTRGFAMLTAPEPLGEIPPSLPEREWNVLRRLTYGPTLEERRHMSEIGAAAWIEEQLAPESLSDEAAEARLSAYPSLNQPANVLFDLSDKLFDDQDRSTVPAELRQATLLRRLVSRRQLFERLVEFWGDHFNVSLDKGDCCYWKTVDDRQVIRPHALGAFADLLSASAHSPAMLVYLDNQSNRRGAPNENYARELMELHTLGIDGGYTQLDVEELARCLTGWTVKEHWWRGEFTFDTDQHDMGTKQILGERIEPQGEAEAQRLLTRLAEHPCTADHLARKLARRFIADDPPKWLVEHTAQAILRSRGNLRQVLGALLLDGLDAIQPRFKRPGDFVVSSLRQLQAEVGEPAVLLEPLARMGHLPFGWPTPDGYPDRSSDWTGTLSARWQFAAAMMQGELPGTSIQLDRLLAASPSLSAACNSLGILLFGQPLSPAVAQRLLAAIAESGLAGEQEALAFAAIGLLASPWFQWY